MTGRPLPPSARYALHLIEEHGVRRRTELLDETTLSERTIDRALRRLEDHGYIRRDRDGEDLRICRINLTDAR